MSASAEQVVSPGPGTRLIGKFVDIKLQEVGPALWAFACFFCLLGCYYTIRPLRDEMGILGGVENLQWLFTGTFVATLLVVPLFGYAAARLSRLRLLTTVYVFFVANILVFYALFSSGMDAAWVARAFFIWTSVFVLFVVSVFWSFMADIFSNVQARRLFGFIAAGGSAGAIAGPLMTVLLVNVIGTANLLLLSALLLTGTLACIHRLSGYAPDRASETKHVECESSEPIGGGVLAGIVRMVRSPYLLGIGLFIWLYTTLSTFLYFTQAELVRDAFSDSASRTALFAGIDLAVNALTICTQLFLTGRIIKWLTLPKTLALIPLMMMLGFLGLGITPVLPLLIGVQVLRRAGNYGITRPAREILFTVVDREARYKAKNFVDTAVYRAGDAISGWVFSGLKAAGLSLSMIAFIAVPVAALWMVVGYLLGRRQEQLRLDQLATSQSVDSKPEVTT